MCPKLTRVVDETEDEHKLSKKPPTDPKPPVKLHRMRAKGGIDDQLEMLHSSPTTIHAEQWPQTRPAPAKLSRSTAMNFDRPTIAAQISHLALEDKLSLEKTHTISLQAPSGQPDVTIVESHGLSDSLRANSRYYSNLETNEGPQQGDTRTDLSSLIQWPFPYKPVKQMRYYSRALSEEDKQALATGEKNHNLKEWNAGDLIRFHESRLELVPKSLENRDAVIKEIQKDKENAKRYLLRAGKQKLQAAQSTPELCVYGVPFLVPTSSPQMSPYLPVFSSGLSERAHSRNASDNDYFSRPLSRSPGRSPLSQPSSSHHSRHSSHVRSPLANQLVFEVRPDVTFDSFLEPHASGKGEAYRGAENAKKDDQPGDEEGRIKLKPMDKPMNKPSNRISKIPSMSILRIPRMRDKCDNSMDD